MLLFSTKFIVSPDLKNNLFVEKVLNWINGGKNYTFEELKWNGEEEFSVDNADKTQHLDIYCYSDNDTVTVHLLNKDGKVIWTNDYVLTNKNDQRLLSVQLYSEAEDIDAQFPRNFNRPRLLKQLINEGYGGSDNGLRICDTCTYIDEQNIDLICDIIENKQHYMMPVIYVSTSFFNEKYKVDCKELAKDLAGVAHVLVERDGKINKMLQQRTNGLNPYNGAVHVYYGKNVGSRLLPRYEMDPNQFRKEITDAIFGKLILNKIDDDLSLNKIRYQHLSIMSKENIELTKISELMLKESESKLDNANNRIQELEDENFRLKSKLQSFEYGYQKGKAEKTAVLFETQEKDYYEGELNDIVLKVIQKEVSTMSSDPNQTEKRKYHVLKSLLQQNPITNTSKYIMENISKALGYNNDLTRNQRRLLIENGFDIEERGHYQLTYKHDQRYIFTLAKTSSDHRSKKNLISEINNILFK